MYYKDIGRGPWSKKMCLVFLSLLDIQTFVNFWYWSACDHHEIVLAQSRMRQELTCDTNLPYISLFWVHSEEVYPLIYRYLPN